MQQPLLALARPLGEGTTALAMAHGAARNQGWVLTHWWFGVSAEMTSRERWLRSIARAERLNGRVHAFDEKNGAGAPIGAPAAWCHRAYLSVSFERKYASGAKRRLLPFSFGRQTKGLQH